MKNEKKTDTVQNETENTCCEGRTRTRSDEEMKKLVHRLNRVEGQVRGIRRMLQEDAYCIDILAQTAAANAALNSFARELLTEHLETCVADDLKQGSNEKVEELMKLLPKLMK